jgi:hypothetical protein
MSDSSRRHLQGGGRFVRRRTGSVHPYYIETHCMDALPPQILPPVAVRFGVAADSDVLGAWAPARTARAFREQPSGAVGHLLGRAGQAGAGKLAVVCGGLRQFALSHGVARVPSGPAASFPPDLLSASLHRIAHVSLTESLPTGSRRYGRFGNLRYSARIA